MNGFTPYISEVNLAEVIKDLFAVNKLSQPKVLIIDNTNVSSSVINLDSAILSLIESGALSLIYWESWQKKGVLGTDSIQYGRVILLTNQKNIESINDITSGVEVDIKKIDIQIAVLLQSHILHSSYAQQNRYQALLFRNGRVLRTNFYNKAQDDETGPFLVSKKLNKVMELFKR